jgi:ribosomal protein S18 acetylase RimI-like enzyme
MEVRRATLDDAHLLAELNTTVQQLHAQARPEIFKPPVARVELIMWFETLLSELGTYMFIGEMSGEAIGYMVAKILHRLENPFTYAMDFLLIDQISIRIEYQGKGYGKRLLQAAYDLARTENIKRIILDVWNFNIGAVEFYKRQGFQIFNERMEVRLL